MRTPGFFRTFGHTFGHGLASELLDHLFPPKPTWSERFLKGLSEGVLAMAPYIVERLSSKETSATGQAFVDPSAFQRGKVLGKFTCPKCRGYSWSTMGSDENGTYERYCTNGLETAYPEHNPNTVKEPCMFRWKATEDHLYFGAPTEEQVRASSKEQTCVPPPDRQPAEHVQYAVAKAQPSTIPPTMEAVERGIADLSSAIGGRTNVGEWVLESAARIIREADAHIARQAEKIRALIEDNEFQPGNGEIWVSGKDLAEKAPYLSNVASLPRLPLVLINGLWYCRIGSGLEPVIMEHVAAIIGSLNSHAIAGDRVAMAQNAAGGVA